MLGSDEGAYEVPDDFDAPPNHEAGFPILMRTARQVVSGHGLPVAGHETMEEFRGSAT